MNTDNYEGSSKRILQKDQSGMKSSNQSDEEKYVSEVENLVNLLGFKLSNIGKIHLQYLNIDRSVTDMALSIVLPAIADDYYTGRKLISLKNAGLFLITPIRSFLDQKMIHESVFALSAKIIDCATDEEYMDSTNFLSEIRAANYFAKDVTPGHIICYSDIKNAPHYYEMNDILKKHYDEYLKACN